MSDAFNFFFDPYGWDGLPGWKPFPHDGKEPGKPWGADHHGGFPPGGFPHAGSGGFPWLPFFGFPWPPFFGFPWPHHRHHCPCFLAGSMVETPEGPVAVENLAAGDRVIALADGERVTREIVWAGVAHRDAQADLPDDLAAYPVRIVKDALGEGVPFKDMLVTSEHCLFLDGGFVPARMLVNGRSIFYDRDLVSYDYYHIETDRHSVLLVDGAPTESYLDTGNRRDFVSDGNVVSLGAAKSWEADAAAPLTVSREVVEPLFRALEKRAGDAGLGHDAATAAPTTTDSALRLLTQDGRILEATRETDGKAIFSLPAGTRAVRILSRAARPSDVIGPFVDDRRALGVLVGSVTLFGTEGARTVTDHLGVADLAGWNAPERTSCRWTGGDALLPLGPDAATGSATLAIEIIAGGPYPVAENEEAALALRA